MTAKELLLDERERKFKLQKEAIQATADWWFKEMQEAGGQMESHNNDRINLSIEELEELQARIKYLALKADWELKEQDKLRKMGQDLLCRKIAFSLMGNKPDAG
jgi:hypothetical protein